MMAMRIRLFRCDCVRIIFFYNKDTSILKKGDSMDNSQNATPQPAQPQSQPPQPIQEAQLQPQQNAIPSDIAKDVKFCRTMGIVLNILLTCFLVATILAAPLLLMAFIMAVITPEGNKYAGPISILVIYLTIFGFANGFAFARRLTTAERIAHMTPPEMKKSMMIWWQSLWMFAPFLPVSFIAGLMVGGSIGGGSTFLIALIVSMIVIVSIPLATSIWAASRYAKVLRYFRNSKEV